MGMACYKGFFNPVFRWGGGFSWVFWQGWRPPGDHGFGPIVLAGRRCHFETLLLVFAGGLTFSARSRLEPDLPLPEAAATLAANSSSDTVAKCSFITARTFSGDSSIQPGYTSSHRTTTSQSNGPK